MPNTFVKFDLWRQLQLLNKLTNTDPSKDSMRVLLKSLRQFHARGEPSSPDVKVVALPRTIFWRLFFGILPLPENKKKKAASAEETSTIKNPSSPNSDKKNLFESSDDDNNNNDNNTNSKTTATTKKTETSSKAMFADSSDDDEPKNKKKNPASSASAVGGGGADSSYTPEFIRSFIDEAREEYSKWLKDAGRVNAVDAANHADGDTNDDNNKSDAGNSEHKKKLKFGSNKKKANDAGPRFGDESSESDDDDEGDVADPLGGGATSDKKKKNNSGGGSDEEDGETENGASPMKDPLAHGNDPKWQKYFARKKEMELIDKDLNRLYFGDYEFFELPLTRKMARNILEASLDLKLVSSYSQGMHEMVGLILWVLETDATRFDIPDDSSSSSSSDDDDDKKKNKANLVGDKNSNAQQRHLTAHIMSKRHIEHDAFLIYKQLIQTFSLASWYDNLPAGNEGNVTRVVDEVHGPRLLKADKPLHDHLKELDVPVATYGLRWLRLLFIREFPLSQAMKVWDVIFADFATNRATKKVWTSIVPELALSMLLYMARELVSSDHTNTLRRLMRFPPIEDVTMIYINAINRSYPQNGILRELVPPNNNNNSAPFNKNKIDPEQAHQHSLFEQILNAVSAAANVVSESASSAAATTKTAVKHAIQTGAKSVFADSSSSSSDDDNDEKSSTNNKKKNQKNKNDDPLANLANKPSPKSMGGGSNNNNQSSVDPAMEAYALKQKMKLLGNRIDRIIIDKLDGSDSDDSDDDDEDKKKEGEKKAPLTEAQIRGAIAELRKIRDDLVNPK